MSDLVRVICQKEGIDCQSIEVLTGGQVNQVYRVNDALIVRVGARADAFSRLEHETALLRRFAGKMPVPEVLAFGQHEGHIYQIQQAVPGQKLYLLWKNLRPVVQEEIVAQLAGALKTLHSTPGDHFGLARPDAPRFETWVDFLSAKFRQTLDELRELNIAMAPGFVEQAAEYFESHKHVLSHGVPALIHGDLTLVNLLAEERRLSSLLDFEFAAYAPIDYELWTLEAFCLYPNDWAEEDNEVYCTADFAGIFPLLRRYYPALFEVDHLRERLDLYHLDATLGSYLSWRKDNFSTIPPERMASKEFYMARITNFTFRHGARMFYA